VSPARTLHVVVPDGIDDPTRPSGGNTYDRRLCEELAADGWSVCLRGVAGDWPRPDNEALVALARTLTSIPDDALVLVDGLVASGCREVMVPASRRLRVVLLVHTPFGHPDGPSGPVEGEREVVCAATAVVVTSDWSRRWLIEAYDLDPSKVSVARPGVDAAPPAAGSGTGRNLLCVGAVTAGKGHDVLLAALSGLADQDWRCVCVGSLTKSPEFVDDLFHGIKTAGLDDRFELAGSRTGGELEASYAAADLLVVPSRAETYGMVVTEALARGLPVLATAVGGVPEAMGEPLDGRVPGLLVPAGDPAALGDALTRWLGDPELRDELREIAGVRRAGLRGWTETADRVADVLSGVSR
jgi:glycosyltransferase involved in cell wall biosynthesis